MKPINCGRFLKGGDRCDHFLLSLFHFLMKAANFLLSSFSAQITFLQLSPLHPSRFPPAVRGLPELSCWPASRGGSRISRRSVWPARLKASMFHRHCCCCRRCSSSLSRRLGCMCTKVSSCYVHFYFPTVETDVFTRSSGRSSRSEANRTQMCTQRSMLSYA